MIPPDLTDVSQESPREACANLAMTFRQIAEDIRHPPSDMVKTWELTGWASRLERACQRMDEEKASDPKFILRETAEAYNDGCADGLDADSAHDMAMGVLAGLLGIAPQTPDIPGAVSPTAPPEEQDTPQ